MLTDEQQALQLAFTSLEEKFRRMQEENNQLVARWMQEKAKTADELNAENEKQLKVQRDKRQKQLLQATENMHVPAGWDIIVLRFYIQMFLVNWL